MNNNKLRKELSKEEFEQYVAPYLPVKVSGKKENIPLWEVYNYIAKVLRTGMQWSELQDCIRKDADGKAVIHYTSVWRRYNQWSIFRVFERSFAAILMAANAQNALDLSVLNGDGTNTIAKKGEMPVVTLVINTNKVVSELYLQIG